MNNVTVYRLPLGSHGVTACNGILSPVPAIFHLPGVRQATPWKEMIMISLRRVAALLACVTLVGTAQEKVDLPGPAEQNRMLGSWSIIATAAPGEERMGSVGASDAPSSEMQRLTQKVIGTWSLRLKVAPSKEMPNGGGGQGTEVWKPGPGGYSLIETYESKGDEGEIIGLGILWPDDKRSGYQVLWCDNQDATGCHLLKGGARWERGQLVLRDESNTNGHTQSVRETFTFNSPNSFVQTVSVAEQGGTLKPYVTIQASRKIADGGPGE
jgi:hypothetical protein